MEVTNNVMMTRKKIWWEQFRDSPCQQNKTKLVVVRFYLYKCGASLKYSCRLNDNFIRAIRTAALTK